MYTVHRHQINALSPGGRSFAGITRRHRLMHLRTLCAFCSCRTFAAFYILQFSDSIWKRNWRLSHGEHFNGLSHLWTIMFHFPVGQCPHTQRATRSAFLNRQYQHPFLQTSGYQTAQILILWTIKSGNCPAMCLLVEQVHNTALFHNLWIRKNVDAGIHILQDSHLLLLFVHNT